MAGPFTKTVHGRTALYFVSSAGCEQMVPEPTHIGVLNVGLTAVHDLVKVQIGLLVITQSWYNVHGCCAGATYSSLGV